MAHNQAFSARLSLFIEQFVQAWQPSKSWTSPQETVELTIGLSTAELSAKDLASGMTVRVRDVSQADQGVVALQEGLGVVTSLRKIVRTHGIVFDFDLLKSVEFSPQHYPARIEASEKIGRTVKEHAEVLVKFEKRNKQALEGTSPLSLIVVSDYDPESKAIVCDLSMQE